MNLKGTRIKADSKLLEWIMEEKKAGEANEFVFDALMGCNNPKRRTQIINNPQCAEVNEMTKIAAMLKVSPAFLIRRFDMAATNMTALTRKALLVVDQVFS